MMAIGPFWRKRAALLGVVPLLALPGCGEGYDVARRRAAEPREAPAAETCRFEQSGQTLPVSRASWLGSLDFVTPRDWPPGMYDDFRKHQELKRAHGSRAPDWPTRRADRYRCEPYGSPARALVVRPQEHTLFFLSLLTMRNTMRSGSGGSGSFHTVAVLDVDGGMREQVLVSNVEGGQSDAPLEMQVAPFGSDVVVVYGTIDSIHQIVGRPKDNGFKFSRPRVVRKLEVPPLDLRLCASSGRLHLLWTEAGEGPAHRTLRHAGAAGPDAAWSVPTAITATALPGTANLLADDAEVFVLWADGRFVAAASQRPTAGRVMAVASRDDGATFSRPVMISDPTDPADAAAQLLVALSGEDLVVYSSPDPGPVWAERWNTTVLDRSLQAATPGGELAGDALLAAYSKRMAVVLDDRPGDSGSSRTAQAKED